MFGKIGNFVSDVLNKARMFDELDKLENERNFIHPSVYKKKREFIILKYKCGGDAEKALEIMTNIEVDKKMAETIDKGNGDDNDAEQNM